MRELIGEALAELLVGGLLVALGFGILWLFQGRAALDVGADWAYALGAVVICLIAGVVVVVRARLRKREP